MPPVACPRAADALVQAGVLWHHEGMLRPSPASDALMAMLEETAPGLLDAEPVARIDRKLARVADGGDPAAPPPVADGRPARMRARASTRPHPRATSRLGCSGSARVVVPACEPASAAMVATGSDVRAP